MTSTDAVSNARLLSKTVLEKQFGLSDELLRKIELLEAELLETRDVRSLAKLLPEAIRIGHGVDSRLASALAPLIERIIDQSTILHREKMAQILRPVIALAIRQAVIEAMRNFVQSIQVIIDRAFSVEGLKWRWESWRTGVPVSEIALRQGLVYKAEHLLLIQRKSCALLGHVSSPAAPAIEEHTFSGLIDCIKSFAQDVFDRNHAPLESIVYEDFKIALAEGRETLLAVVISGNPPAVLPSILRRLVDRIEAEHAEVLSQSALESKVLPQVEGELREGLASLTQGKKSPSQFVTLCFIALVPALLVTAVVWQWSLGVDREKKEKSLIDYVSRFPDVLMVPHRGVDGLGLTLVSGDTTNLRREVLKRSIDLGMGDEDVNLRIFQTPLRSESKIQSERTAFEATISELEELKVDVLTVPSPRAIELILRLRREARQLGVDFFVQVRSPSDRLDTTRSWVWKFQRSLGHSGVADYHILRPVKSEGKSVNFKVVREDL